MQLKRRIKAIHVTTQAAADVLTKPRRRTTASTIGSLFTDEVFVDGRKLERSSAGQAIHDHVHLVGT
jgi:hypothetical protein